MVEIFRVKLGEASRSEVFSQIEKIVKNKANFSPKWIATLNPEILLAAKKNLTFREILNSADWRINDGFGLQLWAFFKRKKIGERLTGVELAEFILEKAVKENCKMGFILNSEGFSRSEKLEEYLQKKGLQNYVIFANKKDFFLKKFSYPQNFLSCEFVLVGLGAPEQEFFIFRMVKKKNFSHLKLAVGIGGTFDFWTGEKKRAPYCWRRIGLEWLWRFFLQPNRFLRIWRATVVFLTKSLF